MSFDGPLAGRIRVYRKLSELKEMPGIFGPPTTMQSLERPEEALRLMFLGLHMHYIECLLSGRMDLWKKAALGVVELAADLPETTYRKRDEI